MKTTISILIATVLLLFSACKKDVVDNEETLANDTIHIVGLPIDTALILGKWQLTGSSGAEYSDIWPYDTFPFSETYQNRFREFKQNGLWINYKIENGVRINLDTLIYSYRKTTWSPDEIKTYYLPPNDSALQETYFYYPSRNYFPYFQDSILLLQMKDIDNSTNLDTLVRVR